MPHYSLTYRVDAPLKFISGKSFEIDAQRIEFSDSVRVTDNNILALIEVEADNYQSAQLTATVAIQRVLDACSYAAALPCLLGHCELTLKDQAGAVSRRAVYETQRIMKNDISPPAGWALLGQQILSNPNSKHLAMCWHRYAQHRKWIVERFVFQWLAFESLAGDADIDSRCPKCGSPVACATCNSVVQHRSSNKNRAFDLFSRANPDTDRSSFNKEVWGRARNSVFHGTSYPDPAHLAFIHALTPKLASACIQEFSERINTTPQHPAAPETLNRYFLFVEWKTKDASAKFAQDLPVDEIEKHVDQLQQGAVGNLYPDPGFRFLNQTDFDKW